jgi:hypothetical protein
LAHYVPKMGEILVDLASDSWIGSVRINYLPVPQRSLAGMMPFNPEQGYGKNESLVRRAMFGLPLLAIAIGGLVLKSQNVSNPGAISGSTWIDFGVIYGLLLLESARRTNFLMPMQLYANLSYIHFYELISIDHCPLSLDHSILGYILSFRVITTYTIH